ncbi:hypothetical protein D3C80_1353380 [compost metagenome]
MRLYDRLQISTDAFDGFGNSRDRRIGDLAGDGLNFGELVDQDAFETVGRGVQPADVLVQKRSGAGVANRVRRTVLKLTDAVALGDKVLKNGLRSARCAFQRNQACRNLLLRAFEA